MGDRAALNEDRAPTPGDWRGRVVLVTGSSMGIGAAVARRFGAMGASVLVNSSRSVEEGKAVADSLPDARYVQADVGDEAQCSMLVDTAVGEWGRLDLLVNNAGTGPVIPHQDIAAATLDIWREVFAVNVFAAWALTVAAAAALREHKGAVVNVTSIAGIREIGSSVPYACSKAATNHMTECLAKVLGPDIRVNAIAPGLVDTPRTASWDASREVYRQVAPMRREATAEDVAEAVVFLAENPYLTGEILVLDGGFGLVH
jgi:ketoreductase RED2